MKQEYLKELKNKPNEQLATLLVSLKEKKSQIEYDMRAGKKLDVNSLRKIKKEIAVILTLLNHQYGK